MRSESLVPLDEPPGSWLLKNAIDLPAVASQRLALGSTADSCRKFHWSGDPSWGSKPPRSLCDYSLPPQPLDACRDQFHNKL